MDIIFNVHSILGERILPILIVVVAIWLAVTWRPDTAPNIAARLFPVLVDIQVTLGLIFFVYRLAIGSGITNDGVSYLGFPFILHPILGLLTAGFAHMAVKGGPFRGLGRWAPLVSLGILLLLVIANVFIARMAA